MTRRGDAEAGQQEGTGEVGRERAVEGSESLKKSSTLRDARAKERLSTKHTLLKREDRRRSGAPSRFRSRSVRYAQFNRWLWIGILTSALALAVPLLHKLPLSQPDATDSSNHAPTEQAIVNPCLTTRATVRPTVVTLFAGLEFGTGSIVSPDGLVLTNEHVVRETDGGQVRARGWNGTLFTGQVLATDSVNDLALVQLRTKEPLPVARFAKPDGIRFGQPVCAFGSPFAQTGILALGRLKGTRENGDLETSVILLLPGYSGGPLLNTQGEMIGVNKAVWLSETGENTRNTAFATTIAVAQQFIEQHRQRAGFSAGLPTAPDKNSTPQTPVGLGSDVPAEAPVNPTAPIAPLHDRLGAVINERSLVVQIVEPNSPAENAGITGGDRLIAVNGQRLARLEDLQTFLNRRPKNAVFTIGREAHQQELQVVF